MRPHEAATPASPLSLIACCPYSNSRARVRVRVRARVRVRVRQLRGARLWPG